jgi:hypothetical protein
MIVKYRVLNTSGDQLSWASAMQSFPVLSGTDLPGSVVLGCWGGQIAIVPFGYIPACA